MSSPDNTTRGPTDGQYLGDEAPAATGLAQVVVTLDATNPRPGTVKIDVNLATATVQEVRRTIAAELNESLDKRFLFSGRQKLPGQAASHNDLTTLVAAGVRRSSGGIVFLELHCDPGIKGGATGFVAGGPRSAAAVGARLVRDGQGGHQIRCVDGRMRQAQRHYTGSIRVAATSHSRG